MTGVYNKNNPNPTWQVFFKRPLKDDAYSLNTLGFDRQDKEPPKPFNL